MGHVPHLKFLLPFEMCGIGEIQATIFECPPPALHSPEILNAPQVLPTPDPIVAPLCQEHRAERKCLRLGTKWQLLPVCKMKYDRKVLNIIND